MTLSAAAAAHGGEGDSAPQQDGEALDAVEAAVPACDSARAHCFGIVLHVAPDAERGLVAAPDWLAHQLAVANQHFAALDVAFELDRVERLEPHEASIADRDARDALGRERFSRGVVHVFIVARLDNVDDEGEIYGVHWRDREQRSRRWIIVSAIAWEMTLAHELGHFFGLKHSSYAVSIMNKTPREEPPYAQRTFHDDELETMRKRRDRMLRREHLLERRTD